MSSGGGAFVDVDGFEEALGDVHSARWFEAVVEADSGGCDGGSVEGRGMGW